MENMQTWWVCLRVGNSIVSDQSLTQSINHSLNCAINQSVIHRVCFRVGDHHKWSVTHSIDKSLTQLINQSIVIFPLAGTVSWLGVWRNTLMKCSWKEEVLDDLPWKDERGPSSIRWTLEQFQRQCWGNSETRWSAYGLFQTHRYHLEPNSTANLTGSNQL